MAEIRTKYFSSVGQEGRVNAELNYSINNFFKHKKIKILDIKYEDTYCKTGSYHKAANVLYEVPDEVIIEEEKEIARKFKNIYFKYHKYQQDINEKLINGEPVVRDYELEKEYFSIPTKAYILFGKYSKDI